jgi:hypothetical protein
MPPSSIGKNEVELAKKTRRAIELLVNNWFIEVENKTHIILGHFHNDSEFNKKFDNIENELTYEVNQDNIAFVPDQQ